VAKNASATAGPIRRLSSLSLLRPLCLSVKAGVISLTLLGRVPTLRHAYGFASPVLSAA
jgi:hypothetical protein